MRRRQHAPFILAVGLAVGVLVSSCTTPSSNPAPATMSPASAPPASSGPMPTRPPPSTDALPPEPPPSPTTTSSTPSSAPPTLQTVHDKLFQPLLTSLGRDLLAGRTSTFLAPFAPNLRTRVGHWFANTAALGVAAVRFAPANDYASGATDSTHSFSRTVVLGIRTPYDDRESMPGVAYRVDVAIGRAKGTPALTVTGWKPEFLGDPMDCNCRLGVVHTSTVAVVFAATDPDLAFWSTSALRAASDSVAWTDQQLTGSGLAVPRGQVIFLADQPFRWFVGSGGPGEESNLTAPLSDALGHDPGSTESDQSRIVLMLQGSDGVIIPNDRPGRQYVSDVVAHESTHQLMNRNSRLPYRTDDSPPVWAAEGIAVAVETLHRNALGARDALSARSATRIPTIRPTSTGPGCASTCRTRCRPAARSTVPPPGTARATTPWPARCSCTWIRSTATPP